MRTFQRPGRVLAKFFTAIVLLMPALASADTLTFEDVPLNVFGYADLTINGGYGGLSWQGAWNAVPPQGAVAGGIGGALGVQYYVPSSPTSCCTLMTFDFLSADFGPWLFGQNPLNQAGAMLLKGWLNGAEIYTLTPILAPTGFTHVDANFTGIDALSVQPIPSSAFSTGYPAFLMDNFSYDIDGPDDLAPVPEPGTLFLLGSGGAALLARRARRRV